MVKICKKPRTFSENDLCQQVQTSPDLTSHRVFPVTARAARNMQLYKQNFKRVFGQRGL